MATNIGSVVWNEAEEITVVYRTTTQGESSFQADTIQFLECGVYVTRDSGSTKYVQYIPDSNILAVVQTESL